MRCSRLIGIVALFGLLGALAGCGNSKPTADNPTPAPGPAVVPGPNPPVGGPPAPGGSDVTT